MKSAGITVERLVVGQLATNCYLVKDRASRRTFIIDPGDDAEYVMDHLVKLDAHPIAIIATHGHFDHILAARALQLAYKIPFMCHEGDTFLVDRMGETAKHFLGISVVDPPPHIDQTLSQESVLELGATTVKVLPTPGHTPGSVCLSISKEKTVFVGDLVFAGGDVGRTDFSYASYESLQLSIKKIFRLPQGTIFYPGHGESSTIAPGGKRQFV